MRRTAVYLLLLATINLWSCSVTKHIPAGESLYTGAEIKVQADSLVSKSQKKEVRELSEEIIRPKPNSTIFGFPYKVWFYYLFGEPKKPKGFKNFVRTRLGEAPVLADKRAVTTSSAIIANALNNEGYFRSTASGQLEVKGKIAKGIFTVNLQPRYTINETKFIIKDSSIFQKRFRMTQRRTLLKKGDPYRFEVIKLERERIDQFLKRMGFYYFRPDHLIVRVDTNLNSHKVNLYVDLKPNVNQTSLKQYRINNIFVNTDATDSLSADYVQEGNLKVSDIHNTYRSRVFKDAIGFRSGMIYSSTVHDASLSRLINLRNFKFVKNRFELVPRSDSALIDVYYDMTPLKKKALRSEVTGSSKSNGLAGFQFGMNWSNKNMFRGAEILNIGVNVGTDIQLSGKRLTNLNNYYRYGATIDLAIPRFILPFIKINPTQNQSLPKTNLSFAYNRLLQRGVGYNEDSTTYPYIQYKLTSLSGTWSYEWRKNPKVLHNLAPFSITFIKPTDISYEFVKLIETSTNVQDLLRYLKILETRLILGGQYTFTYTPHQNRRNTRNHLSFIGGIDIAGNLAGLISKLNKNEETAKQFLGVYFEQYARLDAEVRYYYDLSPSLRLANRLVIGYGLPYGNSLTLPQNKQYFVGGSNSLRAFRARSLGPGGYNADSTAVAIFGFSSYGDMKLEGNTELRYKASQYINLALFVDAGNVWITKYDPYTSYYSEEAQFKKDFYKQLAVGGGVGLRLDFSYIKLRFDLATPLRKPWLPEGERWVLKDIDFSRKAWRQENLILNIAIDYPF